MLRTITKYKDMPGKLNLKQWENFSQDAIHEHKVDMIATGKAKPGKLNLKAWQEAAHHEATEWKVRGDEYADGGERRPGKLKLAAWRDAAQADISKESSCDRNTYGMEMVNAHYTNNGRGQQPGKLDMSAYQNVVEVIAKIKERARVELESELELMERRIVNDRKGNEYGKKMDSKDKNKIDNNDGKETDNKDGKKTDNKDEKEDDTNKPNNIDEKDRRMNGVQALVVKKDCDSKSDDDVKIRLENMLKRKLEAMNSTTPCATELDSVTANGNEEGLIDRRFDKEIRHELEALMKRKHQLVMALEQDVQNDQLSSREVTKADEIYQQRDANNRNAEIGTADVYNTEKNTEREDLFKATVTSTLSAENILPANIELETGGHLAATEVVKMTTLDDGAFPEEGAKVGSVAGRSECSKKRSWRHKIGRFLRAVFVCGVKREK